MHNDCMPGLKHYVRKRRTYLSDAPHQDRSFFTRDLL
jgi:hypothetical protein